MVTDLTDKVRNTFYLIFAALVYLVAIVAILKTISTDNNTVLFALGLLPLIAIFLMVWGYGLKFKMSGIELDYYPVEKIMKAPSVISGDMIAKDAEDLMIKEKTDILSILNKNGLFQGIFTRADAHRSRINGKINERVKNLMTKRKEVVYAREQENLKSIMKKIRDNKHTKLPVLDSDNRLMGIVNSNDITNLLSQFL